MQKSLDSSESRRIFASRKTTSTNTNNFLQTKWTQLQHRKFQKQLSAN